MDVVFLLVHAAILALLVRLIWRAIRAGRVAVLLGGGQAHREDQPMLYWGVLAAATLAALTAAAFVVGDLRGFLDR